MPKSVANHPAAMLLGCPFMQVKAGGLDGKKEDGMVNQVEILNTERRWIMFVC